ncbi:serine/threonine-protein kinase [Trujillonella humicola]|uniref:serine/threonine-protein kinase n=1 Tax=Trujillonella humicola TaxID=3383699 RepID=UPI003905BCFA
MEFREFGPYRIEGLLGRGGMGVVYEAFDTDHQRRVALKVLAEDLAADSAYRERFRREAYAAARLNDPHIVPIHRYGDIDGRLFLDMRLVRGADLSAVLADRGPLAPRRAVGIVSQVAHALDSAHAEGLVHRDVKPSNVLVCTRPEEADDDEEEFVYLVDFGIAQPVMPDPGQPSLTRAGSAVGSFDYMAPERFLEHPADARSDVYSLACVLYESLTGSRPFPVTGLAPLMWAHLNEAPPSTTAARPELPRGLDEVIAKGLAKDPAQRWPSAGAMATAARRVLTSTARIPSVAPGTPRVTVLPPVAAVGPPSAPPSAGGPPGTSAGPGSGAPVASEPEPTRAGSVPPPPGAGPTPAGSTPAGGSATAAGRRRGPGRAAVAAVWTAAALVAALVAVLLLTDGGQAPLDRPDPPVAGPRHDDLLAILPPDYDAGDCRPAPAADDGEVAAIDCGASASQPGPAVSRFFLYPDQPTADRVFLDDVARVDLEEQPAGTSCPATQGHGTWEDEGIGSGRIACYVDRRNDAVLIWTEDEDAVEAVVRIPGGGTQGLTALTDWWRDTDVAVFGG